MRLWLHTILLLTITGFSKAQHFIHLAILGALGLVGLWIMHTLLQDVNKLFSRPPFSGPPKFFLVKRSINEGDYIQNGTLQDHMGNVSIDWNRILTNDPVGCARSFVCQLAAEDPKLSSRGKEKIYQLLRSTNRKGWAGEQIRFALNYGINSKKTESCRAYYKYCPFSIGTMRAVLNFLGAGV